MNVNPIAIPTAFGRLNFSSITHSASKVVAALETTLKTLKTWTMVYLSGKLIISMSAQEVVR